MIDVDTSLHLKVMIMTWEQHTYMYIHTYVQTAANGPDALHPMANWTALRLVGVYFS